MRLSHPHTLLKTGGAHALTVTLLLKGEGTPRLSPLPWPSPSVGGELSSALTLFLVFNEGAPGTVHGFVLPSSNWVLAVICLFEP